MIKKEIKTRNAILFVIGSFIGGMMFVAGKVIKYAVQGIMIKTAEIERIDKEDVEDISE